MGWRTPPDLLAWVWRLCLVLERTPPVEAHEPNQGLSVKIGRGRSESADESSREGEGITSG
jgi:hypothetical protein